METVKTALRSSSATTNPRKRNLLFLTGNKKTCRANSPDLTTEIGEDCDTHMDTSADDIVKRKVVSGPTINIDINEKIEIRLGQAPSKNTRSHQELENKLSILKRKDLQVFSENSATGKRKLPDLKPISATPLSMSALPRTRSSEILSNSKPNLPNEKVSIQKETFQDSLPSERSTMEAPHVSTARRTKWKCKKCSFQHTSKEEVVLHVRNVHNKKTDTEDINISGNSKPLMEDLGTSLSDAGDNNHFDAATMKIENEDSVPVKEASLSNESLTPAITRGPGNKAYKCEACPYKTGCKSQFINHARFHRPNNGDFKCQLCTYNVTHKHLLLQHIRVHGVFEMSPDIGTEVKPQIDSTGTTVNVNPQNSNYSLNDRKPNGNGIMKTIEKSIKTMMTNRKANEIRQHNLMKSREMAKTSIHLCNECPARFFEAKQLKTHSNFHSTNFRMKCSMCSYSSIQNEHLASHMKVHSKIYQLKTRKLLTMRVPARLQHPTQVKKITESARRLSLVNENIKSNAVTTNQSDSVIYCDQCPSKFYSGILYRQHSVYHGKQTSYNCNICNFGTDTNTELAIHKLIHAGSDVETAKGNHWMKFGVFVRKNENVSSPHPGNRAKYYKCNKCPFEFSKRDRYELHLKQHGSNQKFTCTICDFSVNLYVNYVQHLKKHGASEANANEIAKMNTDAFTPDDESSTSTHGQLHKQTHEISPATSKRLSFDQECSSTASTYNCSFCDFMTTDNDLLQEHEELHSAPSKDVEGNIDEDENDDLGLPQKPNNTISSEEEN